MPKLGPGFHVYHAAATSPTAASCWSIAASCPNDLKDPAKRAAGQLAGEVEVTGLLRHAGRASACSRPPTTPARNIWYWRDIDAMAATLGAEAPRVHRFVIDAEASPAAPGGWPKGGVTRLELPNRHLEYALTWYGLAGCP